MYAVPALFSHFYWKNFGSSSAVARRNADLINRKGISAVLAYQIITILNIVASARAVANLTGIKCGTQISFRIL